MILRLATAAGVLVLVACILAPPQKKTPWRYDAVSQSPPSGHPPPERLRAASTGPPQGGPAGPALTPTEPAAQLPYSPDGLTSSWRSSTGDVGEAEVDKPYLSWPLPATGVNSLFGPRIDPVDNRQRVHLGVDLEAPYGAPVAATTDGSVAGAGWSSGHGRHVVVDHPGGYRSCYSHLSQIIALPGERVHGGQVIGLVGNSGRSTGPHLHFELMRYGVHLDPLDFLGAHLPME